MPDPGLPVAARPGSPDALLAAIVDSSTDPIIGMDLGGGITAWNHAAELLFGLVEAEMLGASITRILPPDRMAEEADILARIGRGERLDHFETERLTGDGRVIPVSLTISPIRDAAGSVVGVSKIVRDLSELQRLNAELQGREALLQSILDTVPDALVVIDRHGAIQSFNLAAERMFGFTGSEMIGRNVSMLMPAQHGSMHDGYLDRYMETGERHIIGIGRVVAGQRKGGATFPVELQVGEVQAPGMRLFTGIIRDLTERHDRDRRLAELQTELIHVSRVSELGQMVSALAHEVNQPLTAVANYVSGIRRLLPADSPAALRPALEKVAEQTARARAIVQSLRALVKKMPPSRAEENLETMIQETSALALIGTTRTVSFLLHIGAGAGHAVVDRVQIQQVLLNLMRNAVEAMAQSPRRTLSVSTERQGGQIEVTIADSGPGLPDQERADLFQPFVTTKADGLGVGLSICRTIVESHGGRLWADSEAGRGTRFRFTVPAAGVADRVAGGAGKKADLDQ